MKTTIDEARLIAGLVREALFFAIPIQIKVPSSKNVFFFEILNFEETSSRAKSGDRTIVLKKVDEFDFPNPCVEEILVSCHFPQFMIEWNAGIERSSNGTFRMPLPLTIKTSNQRNNHRLEIDTTFKEEVFAHVQTGNLHSIGRILVENISTLGVGGILKVNKGIPISVGTTVVGKGIRGKFQVKIHGKIVRASLVSSGKNTDESLYQVGIVSNSIDVINDISSEIIERRKSKRSDVDFELKIYSPYHPTRIVSVEVDSASATGFSAKITDPRDSVFFPIGTVIKIDGTEFLGTIVSIEKTLLRVQIVDGDEKDRVKWLKKLTPYRLKNTFHSTGVGADVLHLFCQSGAVSADFLKIHQREANIITKQLGSLGTEETWMHRWIERSDQLTLKAHISSIKVADNLWMLGEIAGTPDENKKMNRSFIASYFESFFDFSVASKPCPKILIGWKDNHPYWKNFQEHLESSKNFYTVSAVYAQYSRFSQYEVKEKSSDTSLVKEIVAADYETQMKILELMKNRGTAEFAKSLDFNFDTFSSPNLRSTISQSNLFFERTYLNLEVGENTYLAILSLFPIGTTVNQTPNVVWLFKLTGNDSSNETHLKVHTILNEQTVIRGYPSPGVIEIFSTNPIHSNDTKKSMRFFIFHPRNLLFFKE